MKKERKEEKKNQTKQTREMQSTHGERGLKTGPAVGRKENGSQEMRGIKKE